MSKEELAAKKRELAAKKIQRFWRIKTVYAGLSGNLNHDFYTKLLSKGSQVDPYTTLAGMMYGRVIATPKAGFPFLKQRNPHVGLKPAYHREDVQGSDLATVILTQWNVEIDHQQFIYIPVVNFSFATINEGIKALNWKVNTDYEIINSPLDSTLHSQLKFVKLRRIPNSFEDINFSYENRWGKIASLGMVASPWLLSLIAANGDYKLDYLQAVANADDPFLKALEEQPTSIRELKKAIRLFY